MSDPRLRPLRPSVNNVELGLFYYIDPIDPDSTYHGMDPIYGHEMWDARASSALDAAYATVTSNPQARGTAWVYAGSLNSAFHARQRAF